MSEPKRELLSTNALNVLAAVIGMVAFLLIAVMILGDMASEYAASRHRQECTAKGVRRKADFITCRMKNGDEYQIEITAPDGAEDAPWIVLKDAARKHLAAVRSGAAKLPGEELSTALDAYSQKRRRVVHDPDIVEPDPLVTLKAAAAALSVPGKKIRCSGADRSDENPACNRYLDALVTVFGRDL